MAMSFNCKYSILIAAFNEAESIENCLRQVAAQTPEEAEILVIDGGSDATEAIVTQIQLEIPRIRYIKNHNDRGKGHAIRRGIQEARGPIQIQFDADLQFLPEDIMKLAKHVESGQCDVALGSRFMPSSQKDKEASLLRNFGNFAISWYASILFGQRMSDVLAGIKAWSQHAAAVIDLQSDGFIYEVEIPARGLQRGLCVREFAVGTRARAAGESKVSILGSGSAILRDMTLLKWTKT